VRQGFVYRRVPRIGLKSIANNAEIDTIWERHQLLLELSAREAVEIAWRGGVGQVHEGMYQAALAAPLASPRLGHPRLPQPPRTTIYRPAS
jgi:hypothetical protein